MDRAAIRELVERLVREELARMQSKPGRSVPSSSSSPRFGEHRVITAHDVEASARRGEALRLGRHSVITPLARDRARELGVDIVDEQAG